LKVAWQRDKAMLQQAAGVGKSRSARTIMQREISLLYGEKTAARGRAKDHLVRPR